MPAKVLENFPGNKALTWEAFWHLKHTKSNYLASRRLSGRVPDCFNRIPLILRSICPYIATRTYVRSFRRRSPRALISDRIADSSSRNALSFSSARTMKRFPSEQKAGRISRTENRTTRCLPENERENFNEAVFSLAFFSQRQDRERLGAISRGLLDCPCRL